MGGTPDPWDRLRRDLRDLGADVAAAVPDRIGKYPVVRELGRTASSVLYLARDPQLGRNVALKVLRDDRESPEFFRRFQREGAIAAALRHPNIITVHEVGTWRDAPFIVMDYVEGGTLAGRRPSPEDAARTLAVVADAVAHAHAQGIVHRDLKPANILLDAGGRPIVTDFGLAKSVRGGDSVATVDGSIMGTPQYMAPEQVRGDSSKVDARTDVYALGAILYELLAGVPPYSDPNLAALFDKILRGDAPAPASKDRTIPRDLQAIALKALRHEPLERYPSASEFARDLRAFLAGEGVQARPPSTLRRVLRRRRGVVRGIAAVAAAAALLLLGWSLRPSPPQAAPPAPEPEPPPTEAPPLESAWRQIGGSATGGGVSRTPGESFQLDLALDPEDRPVVAWRDFTGGHDDIYLRRWDGSAWIELAGSATAMGVSDAPYHSRFPSLAIDRAGNPWVAWDDERSRIYNILLRRWDGDAWQELGGSGADRGLTRSAMNAMQACLALDAEGNPHVSWQQHTGENLFSVFFRKWNGKEWIELGGSATGWGVSGVAQKCANPTMALDPSGRPVIAWMMLTGPHYEVACARWNGQKWEGFGSVVVGGLSRGPGWLDDRCALAIDRAGRPFLAWPDHSTGAMTVYLKKWDGSGWVELGGSATGEGVSRATGGGMAISLALDGKGNPVLTWWNSMSGNGEVYLRLWDGSSWRDLGGSATRGGISRSPVSSGGPVVRVDRGGNPVVCWIEETATKKNDIYLKRFEEFAPADLTQWAARRPGTIRAGETVGEDAVTLEALVRSAVEGSKARLEVEVRPSGASFTGNPTASSRVVDSGTRVGVTVTGLPAGPARWRARTVNDLGLSSSWVDYGVVGRPAFVIAPR
jgi:serine/threonine protein kinase